MRGQSNCQLGSACIAAVYVEKYGSFALLALSSLLDAALIHPF